MSLKKNVSKARSNQAQSQLLTHSVSDMRKSNTLFSSISYFSLFISAFTSAVTSLLRVSLIYGMPLEISMM